MYILNFDFQVQTRGRHSIRSVHAGSDNTFVVKTNGRVLACGSNEHNKLGCNSAAQGLYKRKEQVSLSDIITNARNK